jgi:two-component system C4-dicarboxylate transport sensor histidine kinase DctB
MPNIFSPFVTTKPPGKGMGLGLSLSKVMANDMGGDLVAENTQTGARFILTLRAGALS